MAMTTTATATRVNMAMSDKGRERSGHVPATSILHRWKFALLLSLRWQFKITIAPM